MIHLLAIRLDILRATFLRDLVSPGSISPSFPHHGTWDEII